MLAALDNDARTIVERVLVEDRHVLLFGASGAGKSTCAAALARALAARGRDVACIGADPGSPAFGIPGAACLGHWQDADWQLRALEALCTLDAGRFRLPLVCAVRRLAANTAATGVLLVDAPGVVRGTAGAELLVGLVEAAAIDVVLVVARDNKPVPLASELTALATEVFLVRSSEAARRPAERPRQRRRTELWNQYLGRSEERRIRLSDIEVVGMPPPRDVQPAWRGRQIAWLTRSPPATMGEVIDCDDGWLRVRMRCGAPQAGMLLVRDARRNDQGVLVTAQPFGADTVHYLPPSDLRPYAGDASAGGYCPLARLVTATAVLVNGVFGDPLLHLRLRHQRRSLLFDLGDGRRLPARVAHQVTDVFISHAHADHIGGFLWMLRSRVGAFPRCRIFGPAGIAAHVAGLVNGIRWDRVADEHAPSFEVHEVQDDGVARFIVRAGDAEVTRMDARPAPEGLVLEEPMFRVRAAILDHGTPVLAFAFEETRQINVRKERLMACGLAAGPWLGELKARILAEDLDGTVVLPDGRHAPAGALAEELVLIRPGQKLVYATDLADTPANRERLTRLARDARVLFCEAAFAEVDAEQARRTGHLTARACGQVADAANVEHLVPFHFSRRYERDPQRIYDEIKSVCSRVVMPR